MRKSPKRVVFESFSDFGSGTTAKRSEKRNYSTEEACEHSLRRESDQSGEVSDEESELSLSWMEETLLLTSKYFIIIYNL